MRIVMGLSIRKRIIKNILKGSCGNAVMSRLMPRGVRWGLTKLLQGRRVGGRRLVGALVQDVVVIAECLCHLKYTSVLLKS